MILKLKNVFKNKFKKNICLYTEKKESWFYLPEIHGQLHYKLFCLQYEMFYMFHKWIL